MNPTQYADLVEALTKGDMNDCKAAFETIQHEIYLASDTEGFTRDECFELLEAISALLEHYVSNQFK